jgi:hypothetical protein
MNTELEDYRHTNNGLDDCNQTKPELKDYNHTNTGLEEYHHEHLA